MTNVTKFENLAFVRRTSRCCALRFQYQTNNLSACITVKGQQKVVYVLLFKYVLYKYMYICSTINTFILLMSPTFQFSNFVASIHYT